jgi:S1-C subfamily serine protease
MTAFFTAPFRALASWLRPRPRSSRKHSMSLVWYIESRAANDQGAAPGEVIRGSGVLVRLERLERANAADGGHWTEKSPPDLRNYLLTCAHVVRGVLPGNAGWSPVLGEILCWKPDAQYQHWLYKDRARKTGEVTEIGAHRLNVCSGPVEAHAIPAEHATLWNDWVLLDVGDAAAGPFAHAPAVDRWRALDANDDDDLSIVGYPGGSSNWKHNERVTAHHSSGFRVKREDSTGALVLSGSDETRAGMSGGGVFDPNGALIGLHRAATDAAMERHLVPASHIRRCLEDRGFRPAPAVTADSGSRSVRRWLIPAAAIAPIVVLAFWFGSRTLIATPITPPAVFADLMCVVVKNGMAAAPRPISGLRLSIVPEGWTLPGPVSVVTDREGQACFSVKLPPEVRQLGLLPVNIRCDNAPGELAEQAPLFVDPHGITTEGLKTKAANLLVYLRLDEQLRVSLTIYSQQQWMAHELSRHLGTTRDLTTDNVAAALAKANFTEAQRNSSVEALANVLQSGRPVVPITRLDVTDASAIRALAPSVGAYYEDGELRATGFVVSRSAVLVPNFAVSEGARRRWITFGESTNEPTERVELGQVLWTSANEIGVSLLAANGALPPPIRLSQTPAADIAIDRPIYVLGYPQSDSRTPDAFRSVFTYGERSAMFGNTIPATSGDAEALHHDATTTGGTAGGPLIDRATNAVIGVHLAGTFTGGLMKSNSATPMARLLADASFRLAAFGESGTPP